MIRILAGTIAVAAAVALTAETVEKSSGFFSFPPAQMAAKPGVRSGPNQALSVRQTAQGISVSWRVPASVRGRVSLCRATGRIVESYAIDAREGNLVWCPGVARGVYFVSLASNGVECRAKVLLR